MKEPKEVLRIVGALPALVLVVASLGELWSATHYGADAPSVRDWEEVHGLFAEKHRPGELILFAPEWLDPAGRQHLGEWIDLAMAGRMDAARYSVLWEVSANEAVAPEVGGAKETGSWRFGALRVRRFEREAAVSLFDFASELSRAQVTGRSAGRPAVVLEEVGFGPRRCVRVEPRPNETVTLRFDRVPTGRSIVGYVGLADVFTRRDIRAPASFELRIDGQSAARLEVGVDDGWVRFEHATTPGTTAAVELVISAKAPRRLVCFAAEARK